MGEDAAFLDRLTDISLRPPRVVILFLNDENWQNWARSAVAVASRIWGGGGFIFVPYDDNGDVPEALLEVVKAYDPDYFATMEGAPSDWLRLAPNSVEHLRMPEESDDAFRERLVTNETIIMDPRGAQATSRLATVSTPMTFAWSDAAPTVRPLVLRHDGASLPRPLINAPRQGQESPWAALAVPASWTGELALFAAARTGSPPHTDSPRAQPDDVNLLAWILKGHESYKVIPDELLWFLSTELSTLPEDHKTWFETASPDLIAVSTGFNLSDGAIVIGDTAADFCLAVAYDRLLGFGAWLTEAAAEGLALRRESFQFGLTGLARRETFFRPISLTSASLSPADLDDHLNAMVRPVPQFRFGEDFDLSESDPTRFVVEAPALDTGLHYLTMEEHLGSSVSTPVSILPGQTAELRSRFVAPVPSGEPLPLDSTNSPSWIVDVTLMPQTMPRGRQLDPGLLVNEDGRGRTAIRSSRAGVSFLAAAMEPVVVAGTVLASRLAKPRLRELGMLPWVTAISSKHGLRATLSRPGQNAELIARRLGGRDSLIDLISGPMRPALRAFVSPGPTPRVKGVQAHVIDVSGGLRYLDWVAFAESANPLPEMDLRTHVDTLLSARLLRQGLLLDCIECSQLSFLSLDDLGHTYDCARCGATNAFASGRWKRMTPEPRFFYDLHAAFRDLLKDNGDVVLLTAAALRAQAGFYSDVAEVRFTNTETDAEIYEIDLIALVDGRLTVAEAKKKADLDNGSKRKSLIRKRFTAARLLQAETVLFATTDMEWSDSVQTAVRQIQSTEFPEVEFEFRSRLGLTDAD